MKIEGLKYMQVTQTQQDLMYSLKFSTQAMKFCIQTGLCCVKAQPDFHYHTQQDHNSSAHVIISYDMIHHYKSFLFDKNEKHVRLYIVEKAMVYKSHWQSAYSTHVTKCSIQNNLPSTCLYLGV